MNDQTSLTGLPVQLLRDALELKYQDNQAKMAKALGVTPQRLQYLLKLDKNGRGDRFFKFVQILCGVRRVLGLNWATFGNRLESEVSAPNQRKRKPERE